MYVSDSADRNMSGVLIYTAARKVSRRVRQIPSGGLYEGLL